MPGKFDPYYKWLGIRPDEQPPDHYRLLGISKAECDPDVISSAADQRMAHIRTFQTGPHATLSQKILNEIAAARICLLNPEKKAAYDAQLSRELWWDAQDVRPEALVLPDPSLAARDRVRSEFELDTKQRQRSNDESPLGKLLLVATVLLILVGAVVLSRRGTESKTTPSTTVAKPIDVTPLAVSPMATTGDDTAKPMAPLTSKPDWISKAPLASDPTPPVGDWISKDASYVVSSQFAETVPLLTLLTDQGWLHYNAFTFQTDGKRTEAPYIVITLTSPCTLREFRIQNGSIKKLELAAGLTVWVSLDKKDWQKIWTAEKAEPQWKHTLPKPVSARYVKIGLQRAGIFLLRSVKLFGERAPGVTIDTAVPTAAVVPVRLDPNNEWVSQDAKYIQSSQFGGFTPTKTLLSGTGLRHEDDSIAFHTDPSRKDPPCILITLTSPCTLDECYIQNVSNNNFERIVGLTMLTSLDQKDWQKVWTAEKAEKEWRFKLPKPVNARYVRIGLPKAGAFYLRTVELFGRRNSAGRTDPGKSADTVASSAKPEAQPVAPKADARRPIPDDDALANGMKAVKEVYGDEYESAKTAEQKKTLARKLLTKAVESGNDPATKYLLLRLAKDVAIQATDGQTALAAVEKMAEMFQCEGVELKCEVLSMLAKKARFTAEHKAVARQALATIESAVSDERFDLAIVLGELALAESNDARDFSFSKQVRSRMAAVREMKTVYEGIQWAIDALKTTPNDAVANVVAGKYYCFYRGDWAKGLPMLTLGNDAKLKKLAAQDLQGSAAPDGQVKIGDGWWDFATVSDEAAKGRILGRAVFWYKQAMPKLNGLEKDRVSNRLQESASVAIASESEPEQKSSSGSKKSE